MTKLYVEDTELTSVADAIRQRGGTSASLSFPAGFNSAIAAIPGGAVIPKITNMNYLFYNRSALIPVLLSACDDITDAGNAFMNLTDITSIDLSGINFGADNITVVSMFYGCSNLSSVKFFEDDRYAISRMNSLFSECSLLQTVDLSGTLLRTTGNYDSSAAFYNCTGLKKVALPKRNTACVMGANFFYNCSSLEEVIIPGDYVLTAFNSNAFMNSAIASGTCIIYVPDALVSSYQSATNWSTYASQIKGFSDYPGTPWWIAAQ